MSIHQAITELLRTAWLSHGSGVMGAVSGFFHGTGHGLGLEIHEYPRLQKVVLKAGQCLTVEPGCIIRESAGARIEDVVIVEKTGVGFCRGFRSSWKSNTCPFAPRRYSPARTEESLKRPIARHPRRGPWLHSAWTGAERSQMNEAISPRLISRHT